MGHQLNLLKEQAEHNQTAETKELKYRIQHLRFSCIDVSKHTDDW